MGYGIKIIVEGDYACFTRPEMKVERVSYDVPTPSACVGILKSIYWKPAICWVIDKIYVFNQIAYTNIRRNEVKTKLSLGSVNKQRKDSTEDISIYTSDVRSQRAAMVLKNVKYGIEAHFEMTGNQSTNKDETEEKHYNIILRRLKNGQCFRQPVIGCSEFSVRSFRLVENFDDIKVSPTLKGEVDLGFMLYDLVFVDGGKPINNDWNNPEFSDKANARYYHPYMIDGIIDVAKYFEEGTKC